MKWVKKKHPHRNWDKEHYQKTKTHWDVATWWREVMCQEHILLPWNTITHQSDWPTIWNSHHMSPQSILIKIEAQSMHTNGPKLMLWLKHDEERLWRNNTLTLQCSSTPIWWTHATKHITRVCTMFFMKLWQRAPPTGQNSLRYDQNMIMYFYF